RAQRQAALYARRYEDHLTEALSRGGFDAARSSGRFVQALDLLFGRKQIYYQSPRSFYFPELPQRQFYERQEFPWLAELESKTARIRGELLTVLGDGRAFSPYVRGGQALPQRDYAGLLDNPDWSAFYLVHGGNAVADAVARCPETVEALKAAPLCEASGRAPSVLFSLLRPHVRIPPHTGETNARLICHLPLIVPGGGGLRVGNQTRAWSEGEALIFDDSIEHEAWNDSDKTRVVLLFDIWRPELTDEERTLVSALLGAVASYGGQAGAWD
ncbi:MAG: aspartyl/asparaginyl beta-hydroxylase domain-containing protein, partial [Caulobacteraceae bacterium]